MNSTPKPDEPMEIFVYAAPLILGMSITLCGIRLCLVYLLHMRRRPQSPTQSSTEDTEQPSTLSLAFARSPYFEMFRQHPPPPRYEDTVKHARRTPVIPTISVIEVNEEVPPIIPPPLEANSPPPYFTESRSNSVSSNTTIR